MPPKTPRRGRSPAPKSKSPARGKSPAAKSPSRAKSPAPKKTPVRGRSPAAKSPAPAASSSRSRRAAPADASPTARTPPSKPAPVRSSNPVPKAPPMDQMQRYIVCLICQIIIPMFVIYDAGALDSSSITGVWWAWPLAVCVCVMFFTPSELHIIMCSATTAVAGLYYGYNHLK